MTNTFSYTLYAGYAVHDGCGEVWQEESSYLPGYGVAEPEWTYAYYDEGDKGSYCGPSGEPVFEASFSIDVEVDEDGDPVDFASFIESQQKAAFACFNDIEQPERKAGVKSSRNCW